MKRLPTAVHWSRWVAFAAIGLLFLEVPALTDIPARLTAGCGIWIALAAGLELLSILGFIVVFKLVFGAALGWRASTRAALRGLGASTVLPAGGLVGPALGVRATCAARAPLAGLSRSTIAFVILTNAAGVIVLAVLGLGLWLGWAPGPHNALRTLPAAGVALVLVAATWLAARLPRPRSSGEADCQRHGRRSILASGTAVVQDGAAEAGRLLGGHSWQLLGAVGYYAFDNAVLWAAFAAYGRTPPLTVIVMGYLVGSLGAALPVPAGLGVVEGGLIGALVLYGSPAASAAAAVLLYRGISLSLPVALSAYAWAVGAAPRSSRSARHRSIVIDRRWGSPSTPRSARSPEPSTARRSRAAA
jgi:uncharacterized membrane protein YbhN (UPF0104 family)